MIPKSCSKCGRVFHGGGWVCPSCLESPGAFLTFRERQIASRVAQGQINKQIAGELHLSTPYVSKRVHGILGKLKLSSRLDLALWWVQQRDLVDKEAA